MLRCPLLSTIEPCREIILGGVTPMKSLGMARYMKKSVPGMDMPDDLINPLKGVEKPRQAVEGIKIAIETIQACAR